MKSMNETERRKILQEVVHTFGKKEWFRDASVYNQHPLDGQPTLEIKVNYLPLFERKDVKTFVDRFGLVERFVTVDRNGNPTE